jgi:glyoxylate carboligase
LAKLSWRSFTGARQFARALHLRNQKEWFAYCRGELTRHTKLPADIPVTPQRVYERLGWLSFQDWLGTKWIAPNQREYLPFTEARRAVQKLKLKSVSEWRAYCGSGKLALNIPRSPWVYYADHGWKDIGDWLGSGTPSSRDRKFASLSKAKMLA